MTDDERIEAVRQETHTRLRAAMLTMGKPRLWRGLSSGDAYYAMLLAVADLAADEALANARGTAADRRFLAEGVCARIMHSVERFSAAGTA